MSFLDHEVRGLERRLAHSILWQQPQSLKCPVLVFWAKFCRNWAYNFLPCHVANVCLVSFFKVPSFVSPSLLAQRFCKWACSQRVPTPRHGMHSSNCHSFWWCLAREVCFWFRVPVCPKIMWGGSTRCVGSECDTVAERFPWHFLGNLAETMSLIEVLFGE